MEAGPTPDLMMIVSERRCKTRRTVLESKACNPFGAKIAALHYLIAAIEFYHTDAEDEPFDYVGQSSWPVCTFHMHNVKAKQADVAKTAFAEMLEDCVRHRVVYLCCWGCQSGLGSRLFAGLRGEGIGYRFRCEEG